MGSEIGSVEKVASRATFPPERSVSMPALFEKARHRYKYSTLKSGEFRILELLPGEKTDVVRCRLSHHVVDKSVRYNAISYTWGSGENDQVINLEDVDFFVTRNVDSALRVFRSRGYQKVWIDTICVNQQDIDERSAQVKLMGKIYHNNYQLLVWLGVADADSDIAIDMVTINPELEPDEMERRLDIIMPDEETRIIALTSLLCRNWFSRAWILQEYVLSPDNVLMFCGEKSFETLYLSDWLSLIDEVIELKYNSTDDQMERRIALFQGQARYLKLYQGQNVLDIVVKLKTQSHLLDHPEGRRAIEEVSRFLKLCTLHFWLELNRSANATDPKDRVYSILGLAENLAEVGHELCYDPTLLKVDYNLSLEELYTSVVQSVVVATKRLDILGSCSYRGPLVTRSWVPDWTMPRRSESFFGLGVDGQMPFHASADKDSIVEFATDLSTLTVRGIIWDTITYCTPSTRDVCIRFLEMSKDSNVYGTEANSALQLLVALTNRLFNHLSINPNGQSQLLERGTHSDEDTDNIQTDYLPLSIDREPLKSLLEEAQDAYHSLVVTSNGYVAQTVPYGNGAREGDVVCVLFGCPVPMILRPVDDHFFLIGDVYLHGIMFGEIIELLEKGECEAQDFELR